VESGKANKKILATDLLTHWLGGGRSDLNSANGGRVDAGTISFLLRIPRLKAELAGTPVRASR
jgi:hypothetical protein